MTDREAICERCGTTYGQHCAANDGCPDGGGRWSDTKFKEKDMDIWICDHYDQCNPKTRCSGPQVESRWNPLMFKDAGLKCPHHNWTVKATPYVEPVDYICTIAEGCSHSIDCIHEDKHDWLVREGISNCDDHSRINHCPHPKSECKPYKAPELYHVACKSCTDMEYKIMNKHCEHCRYYKDFLGWYDRSAKTYKTKEEPMEYTTTDKAITLWSVLREASECSRTTPSFFKTMSHIKLHDTLIYEGSRILRKWFDENPKAYPWFVEHGFLREVVPLKKWFYKIRSECKIGEKLNLTVVDEDGTEMLGMCLVGISNEKMLKHIRESGAEDLFAKITP